MNNEIKEILNYFKDDVEFLEKELINTNFLGRYITIRDKECGYLKKLLDYITNLQQENLSLAKENEQEKQFIKDCGFENVQQLALDYIGIRQEKEDYKSRIEKTVEYINGTTFFGLRSGKTFMSKYLNELLNILNGDNNE